MFRAAIRTASKRARFIQPPRARPRYLSTAASHEQPRSWKNSAVRWGIAIAGVYYYNTSTAFAQEPPSLRALPVEDESALPTLESLSPSSRKRATEEPAVNPVTTQVAAADGRLGPVTEGLEEDAHSEGAFNEETGEINWDCPCLGGMAHGPCGPEFREAFSCFVYSKEEPKGMDCIDRFKNMQDCFRQHPDVYGEELEEEGDDEETMDAEVGGAVLKDEAVHVAAAQEVDSQGVAAVAESEKRESKPDSADLNKSLESVKASSAATKAPERTRPSASEPADEGPAPSNILSHSSSRKSHSDDDAEANLLPKAAHDARDVTPAKTAEK